MPDSPATSSATTAADPESSPAVHLGPLTAAHWPHVHAIYAEGIATGHATFADTPPTWQRFDQDKLPLLRTVALDEDGTVVGWLACAPHSRRLVYVGVLEISLYVDPGRRRQGIGTMLLGNLVEQSERAGFWTLQSSVFPENEAAIALHLAHGFRVLGRRERVGKMTHGPMAGIWRDVVVLERRSPEVG